MRKRQYARKKKRRQKIARSIAFLAVMSAMIFLVLAGLKFGKEVSIKMRYPVEYSTYIVKYAEKNDLDPYLVIGVIKQESNFVADARSPYAGGLMQLTEETADDYAKKMGLKNYNYMDPETNIKIGCYVLSNLIDKYGYIDTALAAYNAGMGNVDTWLENPQYSTDGETLSYIPFAETRYYVAKIHQHIEAYKKYKVFEN